MNCSLRLTKQPASKRAPLPRASDHAKEFVKDWERLSRTGRYDMRKLREAMLLLIVNEAPMPPEWLDHPLKGEWRDHRECHVGGDSLLIYLVERTGKGQELVTFVRTGTHAELFNE